MAADNINLMPEDLRQKEEKLNSASSQAGQPELRMPQIEENEIDTSNLSGGHVSWMAKFADRLHQKDVEQSSATLNPLPNISKPIEAKIEEPQFTEPKIVTPIENAPVKMSTNGFELQESKVDKLSSEFHQPEKNLHARFIDTAEGVDLVPSSTKVKSWKQISSLAIAAAVAAAGIVLVFYFGLLTMMARLSSSETQMVNNIAAIEAKLLSFEKISTEINDLGKEIKLIYEALGKHVYWTNFFSLLEKYTLTEVHYGGFSAANNGALTLDATAPDYYTVAKQLKILQTEEASEFVSAVNISSASLTEFGVSFAIEFTLNPNLFYYQTIKQ